MIHIEGTYMKNLYIILVGFTCIETLEASARDHFRPDPKEYNAFLKQGHTISDVLPYVEGDLAHMLQPSVKEMYRVKFGDYDKYYRDFTKVALYHAESMNTLGFFAGLDMRAVKKISTRAIDPVRCFPGMRYQGLLPDNKSVEECAAILAHPGFHSHYKACGGNPSSFNVLQRGLAKEHEIKGMPVYTPVVLQ